MSKYKYQGNKTPGSTSNQIVLEVDGAGNATRSLFLGGDAEELTYTQYLTLKDIFVLTPVEDSEVAVTPEVVKSEETSVARRATQS